MCVPIRVLVYNAPPSPRASAPARPAPLPLPSSSLFPPPLPSPPLSLPCRASLPRRCPPRRFYLLPRFQPLPCFYPPPSLHHASPRRTLCTAPLHRTPSPTSVSSRRHAPSRSDQPQRLDQPPPASAGHDSPPSYTDRLALPRRASRPASPCLGLPRPFSCHSSRDARAKNLDSPSGNALHKNVMSLTGFPSSPPPPLPPSSSRPPPPPPPPGAAPMPALRASLDTDSAPRPSRNAVSPRARAPRVRQQTISGRPNGRCPRRRRP